MIVGRVRKAISNDTGDVRSFVLSVDKEQFKTLLDERDLPREFELGHEKIATVGDVVILSDVFSPSAFAPAKPPEESPSMQRPAHCRCKALYQVWSFADLGFLRFMWNPEPDRS